MTFVSLYICIFIDNYSRSACQADRIKIWERLKRDLLTRWKLLNHNTMNKYKYKLNITSNASSFNCEEYYFLCITKVRILTAHFFLYKYNRRWFKGQTFFDIVPPGNSICALNFNGTSETNKSHSRTTLHLEIFSAHTVFRIYHREEMPFGRNCRKFSVYLSAGTWAVRPLEGFSGGRAAAPLGAMEKKPTRCARYVQKQVRSKANVLGRSREDLFVSSRDLFSPRRWGNEDDRKGGAKKESEKERCAEPFSQGPPLKRPPSTTTCTTQEGPREYIRARSACNDLRASRSTVNGGDLGFFGRSAIPVTTGEDPEGSKRSGEEWRGSRSRSHLTGDRHHFLSQIGASTNHPRWWV